MQIIRKYGRMSWFDLLDEIESSTSQMPDKKIYIEFMDELNMRFLGSLSEGETFKLKTPAKDLLLKFKARMKEDSSFASDSDLSDIEHIAQGIYLKKVDQL